MNRYDVSHAPHGIRSNTLDFQLVDVQPTEQEILEQAKHLGIDANSENHLLWIAEKSWLSDLPEPWVPIEDEHQRIYFYNPETKQSMWDHPHDDFYRNLVHQERTGRVSRFTNSSPEDSGIAGSSLRSTPLQPLIKVPKQVLPKQLSVEFLSANPVLAPDKPLATLVTNRFTPEHIDSPAKTTGYKLSSDFGKNRFLKKDRPSPLDNIIKEEDQSGRESPKVKFNLDLDDLSDASHYSYVETEQSADIDALDAVDLLYPSEQNPSTAVSTLLQQVSKGKQSLNQNVESPQRLKPRQSLDSNSSQCINVRSDGSDFQHELIEDNNSRRSSKEDSPSKSKKSVSSDENTISMLKQRHDNEILALEEDFRLRKASLLKDHKATLENDERMFKAAEDEVKSHHEKRLASLKQENESKIDAGRASLLRNIREEIGDLEIVEKNKLEAELQKCLLDIKESNRKQIQQMTNDMHAKVELLKKEEHDLIEKHKNAKEKLLVEQEEEVQKLKLNFVQQISKEKENFAVELEKVKAELKAENEIAFATLKKENEAKMSEAKKQQETAIKLQEMHKELEKLTLAVETENRTLDSLHKKRTMLEFDETSSEMFNEKKRTRSTLVVDPNSRHIQVDDPQICACRSTNMAVQNDASIPFQLQPEKDCSPPSDVDAAYRRSSHAAHLSDSNNAKDGINFNKILEPIYNELRTINDKVNNMQANRKSDTVFQPSMISNQDNDRKSSSGKREYHNKTFDDDDEVPQIASSLLDVSGQLTDLLRDLQSATSEAPAPKITFEMPKPTPNPSLLPSFFSFNLPATSFATSSPINDTLSSSPAFFNHKPGSYTSVNYPYSQSMLNSCTEFDQRPSYFTSQSTVHQSTKQQLDAQKQWLQQYQKQRFKF